MAEFSQSLGQVQSASQKQIQKFSQLQIQGMNFLGMDSLDLRDEILKAASENPVLKVVSDKFAREDGGAKNSREAATLYQQALEANEDLTETLQAHLLHQLNSMVLSDDELELSKKLIYNLDQNGFYGSNLAPEFLLNRSRPAQTQAMLQRCMERIQQMDPVGTCCKNVEESLFVQAKLSESPAAPELALFLLDGHLEMLASGDPAVILRELRSFQQEWHSKAFATEILLDKIELSQETIVQAITFIRTLNPWPAQGYSTDSLAPNNRPDVVVTIEKVSGRGVSTDYSRGIVAGGPDFYFQVKYASGVLPEVRIDEKALPAFGGGVGKEKEAEEYEKYRKVCIQKANGFINSLLFRESTIIAQACAVVNAQKQFFTDGKGTLVPLTRRQVAGELGIHESSVSRTSNKRNSKFFQTDYGIFPASYFFAPGLEGVKQEIKDILAGAGEPVSDAKLAELLSKKGINISRRTVAKYRAQLGIKNSYNR